VVHNPVHPKVQEAADTLIECLIHSGDTYNAERFSQAALDTLKDLKNGLNQETELVAQSYFNLASIILQIVISK
jgi:hypothetical protein